MKNRDLNAKIICAGKDIFRKIKDETPSAFNKDRWTGKVLHTNFLPAIQEQLSLRGGISGIRAVSTHCHFHPDYAIETLGAAGHIDSCIRNAVKPGGCNEASSNQDGSSRPSGVRAH